MLIVFGAEDHFAKVIARHPGGFVGITSLHPIPGL